MTEHAAPRVSLADRIRAEKSIVFAPSLVDICVVPGQPAAKTYEILLILPCPGGRKEPWIRLFTKLGYGGSTILATVNFPSAGDLIATGEPAAVVHHDGDMCSKEWAVDKAVGRAKATGVRIAPIHVFRDSIHVEWAEEPLRAFLAEHCPLT